MISSNPLFGQILGARIKALFPGKSQAQIARELSISPSLFSNWKSKDCRPTYELLMEVKRITGCSWSYLLDGDSEQFDIQASGRPVAWAAGRGQSFELPRETSGPMVPIVGRVAASDEERSKGEMLTNEDTGEQAEHLTWPETLFAWQVLGDSMAPVVLHEQYVLTKGQINGSLRRSRGIFVVHVAEGSSDAPEPDPGWYCKRVLRASPDSLIMVSENVAASTPFTAWERNCRLWPVVGVYFAGKGRSPE